MRRPEGFSTSSTKLTVCFVALVLFGGVIAAGCGGVIVTRDGSTTYSNYDVRLGEVVFPGLYSAVATVADIYIDGQHVFSLTSGSWTTWRVQNLGEHQFLARVYLIQFGRRADYIGCSRGRFWVEPRYRSSQIYGRWWRLEIPQPHSQC